MAPITVTTEVNRSTGDVFACGHSSGLWSPVPFRHRRTSPSGASWRSGSRSSSWAPSAPVPRTSIANIVKSYLTPTVGAIGLAKLTPTDVSRMLATLETRGYAPETRRKARAVLRRALRRAEQEGIVTHT